MHAYAKTANVLKLDIKFRLYCFMLTVVGGPLAVNYCDGPDKEKHVQENWGEAAFLFWMRM